MLYYNHHSSSNFWQQQPSITAATLHPLHSIFSPLHPLECCSCALARLGGSGHGHSSGGQSFHLQMLIMRLHSLRISQCILMSHSLMGWRVNDVSHNSGSLLTSLVTCSAEKVNIVLQGQQSCKREQLSRSATLSLL